MAYYIKLIDKQTGEPESFPVIDTKLCEHLGVPVHPNKYYAPPGALNWYDALGWSAADNLTKFANKLEKHDSELAKAIRWLDDNYTYESWYGR
jgi:hypothetical protein